VCTCAGHTVHCAVEGVHAERGRGVDDDVSGVENDAHQQVDQLRRGKQTKKVVGQLLAVAGCVYVWLKLIDCWFTSSAPQPTSKLSIGTPHSSAWESRVRSEVTVRLVSTLPGLHT